MRQTLGRSADLAANIVERVPKHLMDAVRARPWAYQPLSRWTSRALEDGKLNGGATHSGAPSSYLGYSHDDALLGYPEFLESTANLNSAIAVASAATASVFRIHWAAIEARYSPSMWPALRTYDLRVRLVRRLRSEHTDAADPRRRLGPSGDTQR